MAEGLVTQGDLAALLGVTRQAIQKWEKLGMPIERRFGAGMANAYDLDKVIDWATRHGRRFSLPSVQTSVPLGPGDELDGQASAACEAALIALPGILVKVGAAALVPRVLEAVLAAVTAELEVRGRTAEEVREVVGALRRTIDEERTQQKETSLP